MIMSWLEPKIQQRIVEISGAQVQKYNEFSMVIESLRRGHYNEDSLLLLDTLFVDNQLALEYVYRIGLHDGLKLRSSVYK